MIEFVWWEASEGSNPFCFTGFRVRVRVGEPGHGRVNQLEKTGRGMKRLFLPSGNPLYLPKATTV